MSRKIRFKFTQDIRVVLESHFFQVLDNIREFIRLISASVSTLSGHVSSYHEEKKSYKMDECNFN